MIKKDFFFTPYFWFSVVAAALSVAGGIVFATVYHASKYMSWAAVVLPFCALLSGAGLSVLPQTRKYAPWALFGFNFAAFLVYVHAIYMYLSDVFYGGVSWAAMKEMDVSFVLCTLFFLLGSIAANVAIWLKNETNEEKAERRREA